MKSLEGSSVGTVHTLLRHLLSHHGVTCAKPYPSAMARVYSISTLFSNARPGDPVVWRYGTHANVMSTRFDFCARRTSNGRTGVAGAGRETPHAQYEHGGHSN